MMKMFPNILVSKIKECNVSLEIFSASEETEGQVAELWSPPILLLFNPSRVVLEMFQSGIVSVLVAKLKTN